MHSASVKTHTRLSHFKENCCLFCKNEITEMTENTKDSTSTDLSHCTFCITITVWYCSSVSVTSNFLTLCKCQVFDSRTSQCYSHSSVHCDYFQLCWAWEQVLLSCIWSSSKQLRSLHYWGKETSKLESFAVKIWYLIVKRFSPKWVHLC